MTAPYRKIEQIRQDVWAQSDGPSEGISLRHERGLQLIKSPSTFSSTTCKKCALFSFDGREGARLGGILIGQHTRVVLWLYDNTEFRIEAFIIVSCQHRVHGDDER